MTTMGTKTFSEKYKDVMPRGAGALFLIQIFSTLSFSVLYSTLILYATRGLQLSDTLATSITGLFIALNYFLHLLGGYLGGRFLSYRSLFCLSMVLQVLGCILISFPSFTFLIWGLSAFLTGCGLNVTCINCMVTQLFQPNDKRRESAFLWNYSGMNIGFFIGFYISGYFQLQQNYQQLFLLSGFGNLIALLLMFYNWKILNDRDTPFLLKTKSSRNQARLIGFAAILLLFLALHSLLQYSNLCNQLVALTGTGIFCYLLFLACKQPARDEKNKMLAFLILMIASLVFWTLYQLAPMGLNLFIERNVDRHLFGFEIAPQWLQNINTIVIILGGPVLSLIFTHLRTRGYNINIPFQFSLALGLIGLAMLVLPLGINAADAQGYTSIYWVIISFVLISLGELFISPIGYAMVGQLSPVNLRGLMMGSWMMITGIAAIFSNHFSKMALGKNDALSPLLTNSGYSYTFNLLGVSAIVTGFFLLIAVPFLTKLTAENKNLYSAKEAVTEEI